MATTRILTILLAVAALAMPALADNDMTCTGKVVSVSADRLVVDETGAGQKTFVIDSDTTKPMNLAANSMVTVTYHEENGQRIASQVSLNNAQPSVGVTTSTSTTHTDTSADTGAISEYADDVDDDALPATSTRLPLFALLGLGALAVALGARAFS